MRNTTPWLFTALLLLACTGTWSLAQERPRGGAAAGTTQGMDRGTGPPPAGGSDYVEDQIILSFKEGTTGEEIAAVRREFRLEIIRSFSRPNLYLMRVCDKTPVEGVIERLKAHPSVKYAEPNYIVRTQ